MARIQFLTDSAADIPADLRASLDIRVLPFPIAMEDREYLDQVDFTPDEFYSMLTAASQIPTHAQLTQFQFEACYKDAYDAGYTDLIYVSINDKASATYHNALQAYAEFQEEYPDSRDKLRVHVVNSKNYTMSYGWAVVQAAQRAAQGASVPELLDYIQDWVDHVRVLFVPLELRFAKKSGRISAAATFVGDALGLKPMMTFEDGRCAHPAGLLQEGAPARHPLSHHPQRQPGTGRPPHPGLPPGAGGGAFPRLPCRRRHRHQRRPESGGADLSEKGLIFEPTGTRNVPVGFVICICP